MPLKNYSVLKGSAVDRRLGTGQTPHYQIRVVDDNLDYRIAVNVMSALEPSTLEYLVDTDFRHPITQDLAALPKGLRRVESKPGGLALDFIRGNLLDPRDMRLLPHEVPGPDNDLNEQIDHFVQRAMAAEEAFVYAFGETWGPEDTKDKYFGFKPGQGIHDIHMNQGDLTGDHAHEDGVYQDGGLIFYYAPEDRYVAYFTKFQSQSWHTNDVTGHAQSGAGDDMGPGSGPHDGPIGTGTHGGGNPMTPGHDPDFQVRIVAAMVNPVGPAPEEETVTLLNTTPQPVNLTGWSLADKQKNKMPLSGAIPQGATLQIAVKPPMQLSNSGGIITLLNDRGIKIHGVSYTAAQAHREGVTIVFGS